MKLLLAAFLTIALLAPSAHGFFFWFQEARFICMADLCNFRIHAYNARTDEVYWHTEPRDFTRGERFTIRNQGMANPPTVELDWTHPCPGRSHRTCTVILP